MRYSIETAQKDGKIVALEDVASVTFDVAHGAPEVGKITPAHWSALERDKHHLQENEGSSLPSRLGPPRSRWPFAASSITVAFVAAALVGVYSSAEIAVDVMRYAGQQNILEASTIGEQVAQTRLPGQGSRKASLLTLQQRAETEQDAPQAGTQEVAQAEQAERAGEAHLPRQSLDREQRAEVLANELAQARRAINRLNLQLRAGAANSTELLGQERDKTAALVQAVTAARYELEEERARTATLAKELATARRETETSLALLNRAREEAMQFNQTREKTTTELQQEDSAEALWKMAKEAPRHVMGARGELERTANIQISQVMQTVEATASEQPATTVSQNGPDAARSMVRVKGLLGQGNIGTARIVFDHVAEAGGTQTNSVLAETYDPAIPRSVVKVLRSEAGALSILRCLGIVSNSSSVCLYGTN